MSNTPDADRLAAMSDAELIQAAADSQRAALETVAHLKPDLLDDDELAMADAIADRITAKLGGSVISSSLPAYVGDLIRDACKEHQFQQISQLYLPGPYAIAVYWVLSPDGTLMQEMRDHNGQMFWRGTFQPVTAGG